MEPFPRQTCSRWAPCPACRPLSSRGPRIETGAQVQPADALGPLPGVQLQQLSVVACDVGDEVAHALPELCPQLWSLNLACNALDSDALSCLTALAHLDLHQCKIGDGHLKPEVALATLTTSLVHLNLSYNRLGDKGARALSRLVKLRRLDMAETYLGPRGIASLSVLSTLQHLNLRANEMTNAGAAALAALTGLTFLNIDTDWQDMGAQDRLSEDSMHALSCLTGLQHLEVTARSSALPHSTIDCH